jgi:hypothetical protein
MLMACLYTIYYFAAIAIPLQLYAEIQFKLVILASFLLVCVCGEVVPRVILNSHHSPVCIAKW